MNNTSGDNDNSPLKAWVRALQMTAPIVQNPHVTLPFLIGSLAQKFGTATALLSDYESLSYRALAERSNQYTCWALAQGLGFGDVVCLLMPNCPDYVAIWLGITRIGGVVSLVNTSLIGDSLAHAINIVAPKHVIVGSACAAAYTAVVHQLVPGIRSWIHGVKSAGFPRIDREIEGLTQNNALNSEPRLPTITDKALYIYTSGTTGLPKAANISHFRLMQWSHWFAGMMDTRQSDRLYNCLPMYHSVGGVVAIGAPLVNGGCVVIRERFSASRFWEDVVKWNCTLFQYIGELCRYLVNCPQDPWETEHQLRLACGNGLAPDVWKRFKSRFRIRHILEFYAATEGTFALYNCEERPGAIGRIPTFLGHRFPMALVRFNSESGEPVRNDEGFCIHSAVNEIGEALGRIVDDGTPASRFEGYADKVASEKKVLRNVFANGDTWFRTGDLMRQDEQGFFYFVDRLGDTFRWKGQNVSTTELVAMICAYPEVIDAVAYGVRIPGTEGRAGMITVVPSQDFDLVAFRKHLVERLPEYARPLFLRIGRAIEVTATFKSKKQDLSHQAYDPAIVKDAVYFNDPVRQAFVRLDAGLYEQIRAGKVRL